MTHLVRGLKASQRVLLFQENTDNSRSIKSRLAPVLPSPSKYIFIVFTLVLLFIDILLNDDIGSLKGLRTTPLNLACCKATLRYSIPAVQTIRILCSWRRYYSLSSVILDNTFLS